MVEKLLFVQRESDGDITGYSVHHQICPACNKPIAILAIGPPTSDGGPKVSVDVYGDSSSVRFIVPNAVVRICPSEVPESLARDFKESASVLQDSPKASAALSRRCLQQLLTDFAGATQGQLSQQIDFVIKQGYLPSSIAEQLNAVREIGNFAAHPLKDQHSGEILPVEYGEAEWNLDVLETLFDYFIVKPAQAKSRKDAFNQKLAAAGRKPI